MRDVVRLVGVEALGLEVAAAVGVVSRLVTGDHRLQREAVVDVGRGDADDEGQSVRVRQDVHLGTRLAPVHGARTCVFAPFLEVISIGWVGDRRQLLIADCLAVRLPGMGTVAGDTRVRIGRPR